MDKKKASLCRVNQPSDDKQNHPNRSLFLFNNICDQLI